MLSLVSAKSDRIHNWSSKKKKIKKYKFGTFNFEITCATDIVEVKMSNKQMEKEW